MPRLGWNQTRSSKLQAIAVVWSHSANTSHVAWANRSVSRPKRFGVRSSYPVGTAVQGRQSEPLSRCRSQPNYFKEHRNYQKNGCILHLLRSTCSLSSGNQSSKAAWKRARVASSTFTQVICKLTKLLMSCQSFWKLLHVHRAKRCRLLQARSVLGHRFFFLESQLAQTLCQSSKGPDHSSGRINTHISDPGHLQDFYKFTSVPF